MIKTINGKNLGNHLRKSLWVEREQIKGNSLDSEGRVQEGRLFGILCRNEEGFYIKMYEPKWDERYNSYSFDRSAFLDEVYWLQNGDIVVNIGKGRIIKF